MRNPFLKRPLREYIGMPQMRIAWGMFGAGVCIAVILFIFIPVTWAVIGVVALGLMAAIVFKSSLTTARVDRAVGLEHDVMDAVIEGLEDAVIAYDKNFTVLMFNPAAENLFNIRAQEVIGTSIGLKQTENPKLRLLRQVVFPSLAPVITKRSEPGAYPQIVDLSFETPYLELRTITIPLEESGGFIKVVRNRTRELLMLQSKNEFITVASHQMRTPLTAINWAFQILQSGGASEKEKAEGLSAGAQAARKLTNLVKDLLNLAKVEEGRFGYHYEPTNIVAFVERVVNEAAPLAKEYDINVYFEKPKHSIETVIDRQKIGIALSNLIDNAIKYNVKNGRVTVRIKEDVKKPFIEISVEDTGIGIKPEDMEKLFTKFFRSQQTIKMDTLGTGLGLYLVKNIVNQHGGEIWAESTLGRGTTFTFSLPTDPALMPQKEVGNFGNE